MKITTSSGVFHIPARILTRSEHTARSDVPVSRALPPELAIDFRPLDRKGADDLAKDSRAAVNIIRGARQFDSCTRRAVLRVSVV